MLETFAWQTRSKRHCTNQLNPKPISLHQVWFLFDSSRLIFVTSSIFFFIKVDKICKTIRFRSTLIKKNFPIKYNGWRVCFFSSWFIYFHWNCKNFIIYFSKLMKFLGFKKRNHRQDLVGFYCVAFGIETENLNESSNGPNTFVLKLNKDFTIESIDR